MANDLTELYTISVERWKRYWEKKGVWTSSMMADQVGCSAWARTTITKKAE
jgi:hypothetical protein